MSATDLSDLIPRFDLRGMDLQLDRMQAALEALHSPCQEVPAIQVAGTNGKGSIASFLASALHRAQIRCGLTTSPHLISWCERIRVDGRPIALEGLRDELIALRPISDRHRLTPFEQLLAVALNHFHRQQVELLVLEVGLGGRLDATTAHRCRPVIALAAIGLDHCEHLGETLTLIAREKAAVITPGATVLSAAQPPAVTKVIEETCRQQGADLHWVDPLPDDWELGLAGVMQRNNAAVARAALQALAPLGWTVEESAIRRGFAEARWPGRLQTAHWQNHPLLLDGAHNPPAAAQLAMERRRWPGEEAGVCWVLAMQAHKQAPAMLNHLLQPPDRAWIVPVPEHDSWTRSRLEEQCPQWRNQLLEANSVEEALHEIQGLGAWPSPMPVVAGSLYLLGDLFARAVVTAE